MKCLWLPTFKWLLGSGIAMNCWAPIKASHVTTTSQPAQERERERGYLSCPPLPSGSRVGAVPQLLCGPGGRQASVHQSPAQSGRRTGSARGEMQCGLFSVPSHWSSNHCLLALTHPLRSVAIPLQLRGIGWTR